MSSGTGTPLDDVLNASLQFVTAGVAGFGEKGFKTGVTTNIATKGLKDVTGATAAEEANAMARQQMEESKRKAEEDRKNAIGAKEQNQVAASNAAASTTKTPASTTKTNNNVGDVKDFLGL